MSLPLPRRIARTALLIAAGVVPVVGAAGAAGAAELPQTPDLGGLTALDGAGPGHTLDSAAQQGTRAAGDTGGRIVGTAVPTAGKTVGGVADATGGGLPTDSLTKGGLPTDGLPLSGLPIG